MAAKDSPFTKKIHSGISIHGNAVRAVMVNDKGIIIGFAENTFEKPILTDDITDPKPLIQAFKQLKLNAHFTSPYAAISFPEKYAFSRQYRLPKIPSSEIAEAISWQIEKIFPFAKEDIYVDWKLLDQAQDHTLVLVTAVPKVLLDHIHICLEQSGLYPISFEPSASAISRILSPEKANTAIILEIDATSICITLVMHATSVATSTLNITPHSNPSDIFTQIKQSIYLMIQKYTLSGDGKRPALSIYLTGEKASTELTKILTQFIELPTEMLSVSNVTPAYHLAYIAAKSHVLPPGSAKTINLLPTELQDHYTVQLKKEQAQKSFTTVLALTIPALIISALTYLATKLVIETTNKAIITAQASAAIPTLGGLNLATINQDSQRYVNLFPVKTSPESTFYTIINTLPVSINLTALTFDLKTQTFTLTGSAPDRAALIDFKNTLEATGEFEPISVPLFALENIDNIPFSLTLKTKPQKL